LENGAYSTASRRHRALKYLVNPAYLAATV
jgi:hypothetical protein